MKADISAIASASRRRYVRRAEKAAGLWPWGWLPLLGLVVTFFYGLLVTAPEIQADTVAQVTRQLSADGVDVLGVTGSGQRVLVRAHVSANKKRIRDAVRAVTCRTWLSDAVCPTRVELEVSGVMGSAPVADAATASGGAARPAKPHRFNFKVREGVAVLRGDVPSQEIRRAIVIEATSLFDEVSDGLKVTNELPDETFPWARERALRVLASLQSGQIIWQGRKFSVRGVADADNQAIIREMLGDGPEARVGKIHLDSPVNAAHCNARFAALLEGNALRFARGSSTLLPESTPMLERVADLARECRLPLLVAGHTDSRGRPLDNRALSEARAEAVRAALIGHGVPGSRLITRGYGDARPVADNATAAGRAANRRIEIQALEEAGADEHAGKAALAGDGATGPAAPDPGDSDCGARFAALLDGNALRFARGSSELLPESTPMLERVARLARECEQPLVIAGHTDSRGQPRDNRTLSQARAESVRAQLIDRGVAGSRLTARGYGDARPIADNATAAGRAANRRIEILTAGGT